FCDSALITDTGLSLARIRGFPSPRPDALWRFRFARYGWLPPQAGWVADAAERFGDGRRQGVDLVGVVAPLLGAARPDRELRLLTGRGGDLGEALRHGGTGCGGFFGHGAVLATAFLPKSFYAPQVCPPAPVGASPWLRCRFHGRIPSHSATRLVGV